MNCNKTIGEVKMYVGVTAPFYHEFCTGQTLNKIVYKNLYSVIGDAFTASPNSTTFDLPNFTNKFPAMKPVGSTGGTDSVTLLETNLPAHSHSLNVSTGAGNSNDPESNILSNTGAFDNEYASGISPNSSMNADSIGDTGSGVPVNILPPYLGINFIICTGV